jgi:hypothetical protein
VLPVKRKLVDSDSDSSDEEKPVSKKQRVADASGSDTSSSESDSDSDSSDSEDSEAERVATQARVKARQIELKKKSEESALAAAAWMAKANEEPIIKKGKTTRSPAEAFKRVDTEIWSKEILTGLEDNSYLKAFGDDGYGAKASEKLMTVQGKKFQHEKTKKKRGSYRGGAIDASTATKSFKYDSDGN